MNASSLFGKRVVLVGGTGLGTVLLRECVRLGAAKVYLVCRSDGDRGRGEMLNQGGRAITCHHRPKGRHGLQIKADLKSMAQARSVAEQICRERQPIGPSCFSTLL